MDEYIDRERFKQVFWGACKNCLSEDDIADLIDEMPAADVAEVIHAHWIERETERGTKQFICSNCFDYREFKSDSINSYSFKENFQFCRKCGARMDGESE